MEELNPPREKLALYIRDPLSLIFKGIVDSVTTTNSKGVFDLLGAHENFITIIKDKVIYRNEEGVKEVPVTTGILKVEKNIVYIFIGTEKLAE
jgi:F0F1-type ATP synthase epsilon subunit